jgi:hypothetical protein
LASGQVTNPVIALPAVPFTFTGSPPSGFATGNVTTAP